MGNETDYVRIDRPLTFRLRHPLLFQGVQIVCISFFICILSYFIEYHLFLIIPFLMQEHEHPWTAPGVLPHLSRGGVTKPCRPKLDSRFILDVNVMDGTIMGPSTPFTKIWRVRNNGSLVWPQGTQLVWIGGDMFSNASSVQIEVCII